MIERMLVPEECRLSFLQKHCGRRHFRDFEHYIFLMARRLCPKYTGYGYWNYYELNNSGWYMALDDERMFHVAWADNDFDGEMSADAFGISSCLLAFHIMFKARSELFLPVYYLLREYATEHAEKELILAIVD